jgi:hypothetical protein
MKKYHVRAILILLWAFIPCLLLTLGAEQTGNMVPSQPRWIWYPAGNPRQNAPNTPCFFRKITTLPPSVPAAVLTITADNEYELFVNGNRIGEGHDWSRADFYNITSAVFSGKAMVAIKAKNTGGSAGLIVSLTVMTRDGKILSFSSDDTWKTSDSEEKGWQERDFNDAKWVSARIIATPPDSPWMAIDEGFGKLFSIKIEPSLISPNNDRLNDALDIVCINHTGLLLDVETEIRDVQDRKIAAMKSMNEKDIAFTWDGKDEKGNTVPNDEYTCFASMRLNDIVITEKKNFKVQSSVLFKEAPNIMKDIFPIGVWFDGRVEGINCHPGYRNVPPGFENAKKYYEENFTDIKSHNIDLIVIPNTPPDYREILLTAADKVGVKIVLEIVELAYVDVGGRFSVRHPDMEQDETILYEYYKKIVTPLMKHPSLFCYQILDEPSAQLFRNFHLANRILAHIDPARPSFSCLCQEHELHRTSKMGTQMIVFDRYPLWKGSKPGEYDFRIFIKLLEMLKESAREIPYWMVVQTCAMDREQGLRYPTPEELRLMVYLSLAHNARGIFFFLHNSCTQEEKLLGLVDINLKPQPLYSEAAQLAGELKTLSPLLLKLESVESIVKYEGNFDVQMFKAKDNRKYMIIANLDVLSSRSFAGVLDLEQEKKIRSLRNALNNEIIPLEKGRFTCEMNPGAGYIFECVNE